MDILVGLYFVLFVASMFLGLLSNLTNMPRKLYVRLDTRLKLSSVAVLKINKLRHEGDINKFFEDYNKLKRNYSNLHIYEKFVFNVSPMVFFDSDGRLDKYTTVGSGKFILAVITTFVSIIPRAIFRLHSIIGTTRTISEALDDGRIYK